MNKSKHRDGALDWDCHAHLLKCNCKAYFQNGLRATLPDPEGSWQSETGAGEPSGYSRWLCACNLGRNSRPVPESCALRGCECFQDILGP